MKMGRSASFALFLYLYQKTMAYLRRSLAADVTNLAKDTIITPELLAQYAWRTIGNPVGSGVIGTTTDDDFAIIRDDEDIVLVQNELWTTSDIVSSLKFGVDGDTFSMRFPFTSDSQFALSQDADGVFKLLWSDNNDNSGTYKERVSVDKDGLVTIDSGVADTSGLKFAQLTDASPTISGQPIGVDSNGNVGVVTGVVGNTVILENGLYSEVIGSDEFHRLGGNLTENTVIYQNDYPDNTEDFNLKITRYNPAGFSQYTFNIENSDSVLGAELEGATLYGKNAVAVTPTESNVGVFRGSGGVTALSRSNKSDTTDSGVFSYMENRIRYDRIELGGRQNTSANSEFMLFAANTGATFNSYSSEFYVKDQNSVSSTVRKSTVGLDASKLKVGYHFDMVGSPSSFAGLEFTYLTTSYTGYAVKAVNFPSFAGVGAASAANYPTGYIWIDSAAGNTLKVK